jgi:hypothetical protein
MRRSAANGSLSDAGRADRGAAVAHQTTQQTRRPKLPRTLSARVVTGTRIGKALRVSYCFEQLPTNVWTRPWRLRLTLDNVRDKRLPVSIPWRVKKRCATVLQTVGGIKLPYVLRYYVVSRRDTRSAEKTIRVR